MVGARVAFKNDGDVDAYRAVEAKVKQERSKLVGFSCLVVEDFLIAAMLGPSGQLHLGALLNELLEVLGADTIVEDKPQ